MIVAMSHAYLRHLFLPGCQTDLHHDMIAADDEAQQQESEMEVELDEIEEEVEKLMRSEDSMFVDEPDNELQVDEDYNNNNDDTVKENEYSTR